MLRDKDVATILEHQWSPSCVANAIGDDRADQASKGAGKSYQHYTQQGVDPTNDFPVDGLTTAHGIHNLPRKGKTPTSKTKGHTMPDRLVCIITPVTPLVT